MEVRVLLSEFIDEIGVSRADVENWTSRLTLSTKFAPTKRGVARNYSRENVLELALLAALVGVGWSPRDAADYLDLFLKRVGVENWTWLAFTAGGPPDAPIISTDDLANLRIAYLAEESPHYAVSVIHVAKIVENVDRLFAEKGAA